MRIGLAFLFFGQGMWSMGAQADSTHYQTLQLGDRSRGMGAAYTGVAADGAAIWFNPAGLPLLEPKLLQGSLSLIQRQTLEIEGAIVTDGPDGIGGADEVEDFNLKSSPTLPGFAVASFALGKPRDDLNDRKPMQMAISVFQTYNQDFSGDITFEDELGRTNSLQFFQADKITYFGAGIGYRVTRKFSVGITALAGNRVVQHVETAALALGGTQDPSLGSPCGTSPTLPFCIVDARQINRNTVFSMNSWEMIFRIGLLQILGERFRLGLMFQTPSFHLGGKSSLRFELSDLRSGNDPLTPNLSDSIFGDRKFGSRSPIPWELRLGVSYVISKKVMAAVDLQLVGPVAGGSIAPGIPQIEGRANTSGILLADSTKRVFTWNISIGSEIQINKYIFTRFGFLTDNSSAPDTGTGAADAIRPSKINRLGFSASVGGHKNEKGLSAGVSMLFGKGTGNGLDFRGQAFDNDTNFIRVPVKERILIVSIGGDIGQAADVVKTQVKEKKTQEEIKAEEVRESRARREDMEAEADPKIKAAKQRAIDARTEVTAAEERVEEAEQEVRRLEREKKIREGENLDEADQEAIHGSTQTGIETIR